MRSMLRRPRSTGCAKPQLPAARSAARRRGPAAAESRAQHPGHPRASASSMPQAGIPWGSARWWGGWWPSGAGRRPWLSVRSWRNGPPWWVRKFQRIAPRKVSPIPPCTCGAIPPPGPPSCGCSAPACWRNSGVELGDGVVTSIQVLALRRPVGARAAGASTDADRATPTDSPSPGSRLIIGPKNTSGV